jgi:DNA polymerase-1
LSETIFTLVTKTDGIDKLVEAVSGQPVIGVDTETTGLDPMTSRVRLLQISTDKRNFVVDLFKVDAFTNAAFRELFTAPQIIKIFHNAKFDMKMLLYHFQVEVRGIFDTMLASQLLSAGRSEGGNSLAAVSVRYLKEEIDKSQQVSDWSTDLSDEQYEYAAKDAEILIPLREKLVQALVEAKMIEVAKLEFDCVLPLSAMELTGVYMEADCWREIVKKTEAEHEILSAQLRRELAAGIQQLSFFDEPTINLDSPTQVTEALQRMGIKVEGTRGWQLQPLAKEYKVIEKLLEYRHAQKSLSSYGASFDR